MKKLVMALFAVAISVSAYAIGENPGKASLKELRNEITEMIGHPKMDKGVAEERVTLHFTVNARNEIVVLSTSNNEFDEYIKEQLNYRQLKKSSATINKKYTLPLIIRKG